MKTRTKVLAGVTAAALLAVTLAAAQQHPKAAVPVVGPVIFGTTATSAYWVHQTTGDCLPMAAADVVGDKTGTRLTEAQAVAAATVDGMYSPGKGGNLAVVPAFLRGYGVTATSAAPLSFVGLEQSLAAGDSVIAAVNGGQLWASSGAGTDSDGLNIADHAVVVDQINATAGTVTLTDSAYAGGALETVPLSVFVSSWNTGGDWAVVAL